MSDTGSISESDNPIEAGPTLPVPGDSRESTGRAVGSVADDTAQTTRGRHGWLSLVVAFLFALFYVYDLWEAVGNLVQLPIVYDAYGYGSENVPWWLLWVGVLIPLAVYVAAFIGGRRRNVAAKALIFFVGLAVVAGLSIGVLALEEILRAGIVVA